jgi:hypothetical protein
LQRGPDSPYNSHAWKPLLSHYNGPLLRPQTALTIALHIGLYLAIIMDHYRGPQTVLTIALHGGLYLAIILVSCRGLQTALIIALRGGL